MIRPYELRCEYLNHPEGLHTPRPRFSWKVQGECDSSISSAYRIRVVQRNCSEAASDQEVWDSGKVHGNGSAIVTYNGKKLASGSDYTWTITLWDEQDRASEVSEPAGFSMALLDDKDWKAEWITDPGAAAGAPMYRVAFDVHKQVVTAKLYISGLGYYEASINGRKVGDSVLDPGWTDYSKRVLYATYDVARRLNHGTNVVGVMLGRGWFDDRMLHPRQQLIAQLHIGYADGSIDQVVSGREGWQLCTEGPVLHNSIYFGETYDARKQITGWDTPGYSPETADVQWRKPLVAEPPGGKLVSQMMEAIKDNKELSPIRMTEPAPGIFVYDFGQNFAGWARLRVQGPSGLELRMRYAELIYENGLINQENLRGISPTDTYLLKGEGVEIYEPRFTYHGFRYVQLEGFPGKPDLNNVVGKAVYSSVEETGQFRCGVQLLNRLHQAVQWTERSNLHSIPTDCPQRDERLGWLNDLTVRGEEAVYNFGMAAFFSKYMDDIADTQGAETGAIADTAPNLRYGSRPADPVCSSYLIIPWLLYVHYGDRRTIERHYAGLERWFGYLEQHSEDHIVTYSYYGDWAPPITQVEAGNWGVVSTKTPGQLISTGYFYLNAVLLSRMANILGSEDKQAYYEAKAVTIKDAFNAAFFHPITGQYASGNQSSNAFPLWLGIVPKDQRAAVLANLIADIERQGMHITTGNLCTKYLIDVLTTEGRADVAYQLLTQTAYPSWGYMLENGATTIWERWEYVATGPLTSMASHNHPMYGAVGSWFYAYAAGIRPDDHKPGYEHFYLAPVFLKEIGCVDCKLETVRGTIESKWSITASGIEWKITVPFNAKATVIVPAHLAEGMILVGGRVMWQNGTFNEVGPEVDNGLLKDGKLMFEVRPGIYRLTIVSQPSV